MIDTGLIDDAINNKRIHVFKNPFPNMPEWDKFLSVLHKYIAKDLIDHPDETSLDTNNLNQPYLSFKLRVRFWSRLTFQLYDKTEPLEDAINELLPVLEWAKEHYPTRLANTFSLISLMANRGQVGLKHSDDVDQFQWNCIGTSMWRTGEDLEVETFIEPGDFIFIPKGIPHEIETLTPRAVINLVLINE